MFLEYWQLAVLLGVFYLGMKQLFEQGKRKGLDDGVELGMELTLLKLQQEKIIEIDEFENIRRLHLNKDVV